MMLTITFGLSEIFILLFGILIGLVIGAFVFVKRKRKIIMSFINKNYSKVASSDKTKINEIINNVYSYHIKSRKTSKKILFGLIKIKKKVNQEELALKYLHYDDSNLPLTITNEIIWLVKEIAKTYYPDSKEPLAELSIDELLQMSKEILSLSYNILTDLGIPNIEKIKISQLNDLLKITNKVNKLYQLKSVQITIDLFNIIIKLQSILTPIYWIKNGTNTLTVSSLSQLVIKSMFEVIAKETANIYSKSFTKK